MGFLTAQGSFSDISLIAPELKVAAVNLSCGYYAAHTLHEYINVSELNRMIHKVGDIIAEVSDLSRFDYIEVIPLLPAPIEKARYDSSTFRDIYTVLLDFYSSAELDSFRKEFGDHVLWQLYEAEVAPFYRR